MPGALALYGHDASWCTNPRPLIESSISSPNDDLPAAFMLWPYASQDSNPADDADRYWGAKLPGPQLYDTSGAWYDVESGSERARREATLGRRLLDVVLEETNDAWSADDVEAGAETLHLPTMLASVLATPAAPGLHKPTVDIVLARFSEDASWSSRFKDQARAPPPLGPTPRTKDALGHDRHATPRP